MTTSSRLITHFMTTRGLALSQVVFKDGILSTAWVVNGEWQLENDGTHWLALEGGQIRNSFEIDLQDLNLLPIPPEIGIMGYAAVFNWVDNVMRIFND